MLEGVSSKRRRLSRSCELDSEVSVVRTSDYNYVESHSQQATSHGNTLFSKGDFWSLDSGPPLVGKADNSDVPSLMSALEQSSGKPSSVSGGVTSRVAPQLGAEAASSSIGATAAMSISATNSSSATTSSSSHKSGIPSDGTSLFPCKLCGKLVCYHLYHAGLLFSILADRLAVASNKGIVKLLTLSSLNMLSK